MPKPGATKTYTREELEAHLAQGDAGEEALHDIAATFKIDSDSYPTWPEVVEAVIEAQGGEPAAGDEFDEPAAAGDGGEEPFEPYTEKELKVILEGDGTVTGKRKGLEEMKQILTDWKLEIPGERPRGETLIKILLDAQAKYQASRGKAAPAAEDAGGQEEVDEGADVIDIEQIVAAMRPMVEEVVHDALKEVVAGVHSDNQALAKILADIRGAMGTPTPTKAAAPAKAAAKAAPAVTRRAPPR